MGRSPGKFKCSGVAAALLVVFLCAAAPPPAAAADSAPASVDQAADSEMKPAVPTADSGPNGAGEDADLAPVGADKIDIRSDRLDIDNEKRIADFSGNVVAQQAETVIEADRLRVYYKQSGGESVDALEKIVATGNVRIQFENGLAETPEAVYSMDTRVFVLTGTGSRVTSGKSHIAGEKITLRRDDGRVTVEGGERRQVEAIFYPEDEDTGFQIGGEASGKGSPEEKPDATPSNQ
jgi:lipopolysaccharide export system protein LptA